MGRFPGDSQVFLLSVMIAFSTFKTFWMKNPSDKEHFQFPNSQVKEHFSKIQKLTNREAFLTNNELFVYYFGNISSACKI